MENTVTTCGSRQYRTSENLGARIRLHQLYSTNQRGWMRWVCDQFSFGQSASVLELGCGTGELWRANAARVGPGLAITLTDASAGMLREAFRSVTDLSFVANAAIVEAEAIPFRDRTFTAVIANHMLYHVKAVERALSEISRVLDHNGTLYAAANGKGHLQEIPALLREFDGTIDCPMTDHTMIFGLENGAEQLRRYFPNIEVRRYPDSLAVPEAKPLVDYVLSMAGTGNIDEKLRGDRIGAFESFVARRIREQSSIRITKDSGLFIASDRAS